MKYALTAAITLLSVGCVSNQEDLSPTFGQATAANNAAHIIDERAAEGAPEGNGAAIDLATHRYETDTVKKLKRAKIGAGEGSSD